MFTVFSITKCYSPLKKTLAWPYLTQAEEQLPSPHPCKPLVPPKESRESGEKKLNSCEIHIPVIQSH